jgi:hypothetical protein
MSNENAELIRRAYRAYANGELATMLQFVDPDLEWTYLDPTLERPTPSVCHGRHELERVLRGWAEHGLRAELDEVAANGDWSWSACGGLGWTPTTAGAGTTAPTACSRYAAGGSLPCATAAIGRRPCTSPASGREMASTDCTCTPASARHKACSRRVEHAVCHATLGCLPQVDVGVEQLAQAQPDRQGGRQQQPGVGDQPLVVKGDSDFVGVVASHLTGVLLPA